MLRPSQLLLLLSFVPIALAATEGRFMEALDRGLVAVHQADGKVFLSWRLLASDPPETAFHVYRTTGPGTGAETGPFASKSSAQSGTQRLTGEPLASVTWYIDDEASLEQETSYQVQTVLAANEGEVCKAIIVSADKPPLPYLELRLQTPEGYTPGDASLGDLDGDGSYEIVLKQEQTPRDNSQSGFTGSTLLQAYHLDGRRLWTINLGRNIREGAHYTQFLVYDFDSDGRAEVVCKTADGTLDGTGKVLGAPLADWRSPSGPTIPTSDRTGAIKTATGLVAKLEGHILAGPEYLTVFDGQTGAALATTPYLPRRHPETSNPTPDQLKAIWGDGYGNRSDRYLACVAYLDGKRPSLVMCRGYYTRTVLSAWDWRAGRLQARWVFDSETSSSNHAYRGQGNHNLAVADVDGDGRDEIIYGAAVIDDDGSGLYSTGWGHGDALHVGDLDPSNPGLEIFSIQERFDKQGLNLRDAKTGRALFTLPSVKAASSGNDKGEGPGRGNAFNIDPRYPGAECWAAGSGMDGLYTAGGYRILEKRPKGFPCNFGLLWDGDLLYELLDQNRILKWNWQDSRLEVLLSAQACTSNNGTKATPILSADLWGDWREEVIWRTRDNQALRIYTSTHPTPYRLVTLMHDPVYRLSIAWQNVAYNQPPHPSFYLDSQTVLPSPPRHQYPANLSPQPKH